MAATVITPHCAAALRAAIALGTAAWSAVPARAQELPPPAYQIAAAQSGVPSSVLYAVALQESGTRLRGRLVPWPWTLNVAGTPQRHATRADACLALRSALRDTPAERIDVGLGQVNAGYHAHRVQRPCALLDPYRNLGIAAEILHEQHRPGEDWLAAVGRYHRPAGGPPAARYRGAVQRYLVRVLGNPQAMASLNPRRETTP
ncbi:transglycosylase SLT domain-containing protein [Xanthomonas sontii]|uniref:transglycosylase SLT domain-containing protein n=1 Tax=Xanthomonas sontii TaxID=2650745 RepID=UPI0011E4C1DE|nr:transglycosylase SLT domain-containing protein [Xanthomonas sontii]MDQ7759014.1 transglycosylase SLT domain-containing protein [Xanthomonas sontii]TYD33919.1 lytic transglycosylase [Xanthomonas sontii]UZK07806.1 lytic transglycosylase domain-containing protein [Xanthomonas sontii]